MAWSIPKSFKRALAWFQRLLGLSKEAQAEIEARCARRAKVAACAAQLRMVQMVWEASERAEGAGTDFAAWKADFVQVLRQSWAADGYRTALVFDVAIQQTRNHAWVWAGLKAGEKVVSVGALLLSAELASSSR